MRVVNVTVLSLLSLLSPLFLALSWFTMEQVVDLKAEGLWEELLDDFQPEIVIQDWWVNEHPPPPPPAVCDY